MMYEHYRVIECTKTKVTDPLPNAECPNEKEKSEKYVVVIMKWDKSRVIRVYEVFQSGLPNPNFRKQEFFLKNQDLIRELFF
jgi:hypothetical protein